MPEFALAQNLVIVLLTAFISGFIAKQIRLPLLVGYREKLLSASIILPKELSSQILATCQIDYKGPYFYQVPTCFSENKHSLTVYHELRSAGQSLGYLAKEYSYSKIEMFDRKQFVLELLLVLFAFIGVSGCSLFYLYRYVMKPMHSITQTLKHERNIIIPAKSFSLLEINIFVETLRQAFDEIASYQETLKQNAALTAIGRSTAMVAHDVRRPLTSMKALLSILPSIKDDPAQLEKMTANVDQTITRTNAMLNEIMDFSRDATALELKECSPKVIFASAVSEALRNHPEADVEVVYELDSEHVFHCDVARVTRVFANLIDNALGAMEGKGKRGRLRIVTHDEAKEGKRFIVSEVRDSGGGIPEEYLPKIFDPFFTKGKKGGTGLGLAICQKIANMHGGEIKAWNIPTMGAVFSVKIPAGTTREVVGDDEQNDLIHDSKELQVFRAEETRRESLGDTANTAKFMRINKERGRISTLLVVDDEPLFRETIRSLLNTLGQVKDHVKVIEADSAEMGLKQFETMTFDCVIADIDLGRNKMNGYKLTQEILEKYPSTYVLIHSNRRRDEMDEKIRVAASDHFLGFLPKPMKADELLQFLACKSFETSPNAGMPQKVTEKTALLLNDDEGLLMCFGDDLKKLGYQVLDAKNVSGAMEHFLNRKIDMIVSDINLGEREMTGYDFLGKVREKDAKIPFVFTSGYNRRDEWEKAEKAGATEYLQIPYELHELKKALGV